MARAKGGPKTRQRRKKILKRAKGFTQGKRRLIRQAIETVKRAERYSYRDRKVRKRDFRSLWIVRIGNAAKELGLSYSSLLGKLSKIGVEIDRKMLAELAARHGGVFARIVEFAKVG